MNPRHSIAVALLAAGSVLPPATAAAGLSVEVWTDRGRDAVYNPGDALEVKARTSRDANLLVYEIDAEGYVHLLFPEAGQSGFVAGRETHRLPGSDSDVEWVVQGPVGQGYIVAIASDGPFPDLPWYLRPYNRQAEEVGYYDQDPEVNDEGGVTAEGRVVGDPFVAMERIRRRVVADEGDLNAFSTAYTSYYVHHEVRYPRYVCYDCHRPNRWAWWDGFDPYYASCSVFDVRVNRRWAWGPTYWFGYSPYFVYVYRSTCPPYYRPAFRRGDSYSSWDGWRRWRSMWGSRTRRYKSPPPAGYEPPDSRHVDRRATRRMPPGFIPPPGADDPTFTVSRTGTRRGGGDPGPPSGLVRRSGRGGGAVAPPPRFDRPSSRGLPGLTPRRGRDPNIRQEPINRAPRGEPGDTPRVQPRGTPRADPGATPPPLRRGGFDRPLPPQGRSHEVRKSDQGERPASDRKSAPQHDLKRDAPKEAPAERREAPRDRGSARDGNESSGRSQERSGDTGGKKRR